MASAESVSPEVVQVGSDSSDEGAAAQGYSSSDSDESLEEVGGFSEQQAQVLATNESIDLTLADSVDSTNQGYEPVDITIPTVAAGGEHTDEASPKMQAQILREIRRNRKAEQLELHRLHLHCLIASLKARNAAIESGLARGILFSMLPPAFLGRHPLPSIDAVVAWFRATFSIASNSDGSLTDSKTVSADEYDELVCAAVSKEARSWRGLVEIFVTLCRVIGYQTRMVWAFWPLPRENVLSKRAGKRRRVSVSEPISEEKREMHALGTAPTDCWAEVYIDRQWTHIDCVNGVIGKPLTMEPRLGRPLGYVAGISASGYLKDVSPRYAADWLTTTERQRLDPSWWKEIILECNRGNHGEGTEGGGALTRGYTSEDNALEDQSLELELESRAMPTTVAGFKGHRLYVLERHLKADEVLHPDPKPLAMVKSEAVYLRRFVQKVRSREAWLKMAREVIPGSNPVPTHSKRKGGARVKERELYGEWQTVPYAVRKAKNGLVPKNAYGTVDLFKPCMMPEGCVLLYEKGIHKIAAGLEIDYAMAVVDFEFRKGQSTPVFGGTVVCSEHAELLLEAYAAKEHADLVAQQNKRSTKALQMWRRLVKGALIKHAMVRKHWSGK